MSTATKVCRKCGETKELSAFYKRQSWCKPCHKADGQHRHYAKKFGITIEVRDAMIENQKGVCAICHRPNPNGSVLSVDHCHTTDRVRACLCTSCNIALGMFQDNPDRMSAAAAYVEQHESAH